jgi:hypothetical protein
MSPTRREFLATSYLLPWLASCGKEESPASPSTPVAPLAQILFSQDFNSAPLGVYGPDALAAGWMGATPGTGVRQGWSAFSTFFGGSDPSWAPLKDEHVTFDQFVVSTARA